MGPDPGRALALFKVCLRCMGERDLTGDFCTGGIERKFLLSIRIFGINLVSKPRQLGRFGGERQSKRNSLNGS